MFAGNENEHLAPRLSRIYCKETAKVCLINHQGDPQFGNASHLIDTSIIAKIKYFPNKGTTKDVGGMISTTRRKNTYKLVRMEIDRVTCGKDMTQKH